MAVKVIFEAGHVASLKSKITPEGFTHDWELYVRGCDSTDISNCIDKVVFHLHKSFPKPKRTFKEPPYVLKESGYAGFVLPIDIYFKNEPKKVCYPYDLKLQNTGTIQECVRFSYIFKNPSDEFRRKLYKCGGVSLNSNSDMDKTIRDSTSATTAALMGIDEQRTQKVSKSKTSGGSGGGGSGNSGNDSSNSKKHKNKSDEPKVNNAFATLFGPPITKTSSLSKVSPELKTKLSPTSGGNKSSQSQKADKPPKDKIDKEKKDKNKYNSPIKEKLNDTGKETKKIPEEKHDKRDEKKKDKSHSKERDKSKDKQLKRTVSPPRTRSPAKRPSSPLRNSSATSKGDDSSMAAISTKPPLSKYSDTTDRPSSSGSNTKKSKKDKKEKSHDKDRDRTERKDKEHKMKDERTSNVKTQSSITDTKTADTKKDGSHTPKDLYKEKIKQQQHQESKTSSITSTNDILTSQIPLTDSIKSTTTTTPAVVPQAIENKKPDKDPERKHKHKKKEKNKDKDKEHSRERKKDKSQKQNKDDQGGGSSSSSSAMSTTISSNIIKGKDTVMPPPPAHSNKHNPLNTLLDEMADKETSDSEDDRHHAPIENIPDNRPDLLVENSNSLPDVVTVKQLLFDDTKSVEKLDRDKSEKSAKRSKKDSSKGSGDKDEKKKKRKSKDELQITQISQKRKSPSPLGAIQEPVVKQMRKEDSNPYITGAVNSMPLYSTPSQLPPPQPLAVASTLSQHSPQTMPTDGGSNSNSNCSSSGSGSGLNIPSSQMMPLLQNNPVPSINKQLATSPTAPPTNASVGGRASPSPARMISSPLLLAPPVVPPAVQQQCVQSNSTIHTGSSISGGGSGSSGGNPNQTTINNVSNSTTTTSDYMSELKDLQHKIMTLQDNNELQQVVEMIATTGCYEITTKTFDFDLCALDRSTVQRLQDFFSTSCS